MNPSVNLNCVVLSGRKNENPSDPHMFNVAAEFFVAYWNRHFQSLGVNKKIDMDEFARQERVVMIFADQKIVAMLTLNCHSMKIDEKRSSYFSQFTGDFLSVLSKMNLESAQSVQWLMVNRDLTQDLNRLPFAEIIISLALKYQIQMNLDASLALARMDNACAQIGYKLGFVRYCEPVEMYSSPLAQLICRNPQPNKKPEVAALVERLWLQKTDYTLRAATVAEAA